MVLALCTSSNVNRYLYEVLWRKLEWFSSNRADMSVTDRQMPVGKAICLPTLKGGDIICKNLKLCRFCLKLSKSTLLLETLDPALQCTKFRTVFAKLLIRCFFFNPKVLIFFLFLHKNKLSKNVEFLSSKFILIWSGPIQADAIEVAWVTGQGQTRPG